MQLRAKNILSAAGVMLFLGIAAFLLLHSSPSTIEFSLALTKKPDRVCLLRSLEGTFGEEHVAARGSGAAVVTGLSCPQDARVNISFVPSETAPTLYAVPNVDADCTDTLRTFVQRGFDSYVNECDDPIVQWRASCRQLVFGRGYQQCASIDAPTK
jgi:hypothetical protein